MSNEIGALFAAAGAKYTQKMRIRRVIFSDHIISSDSANDDLFEEFKSLINYV